MVREYGANKREKSLKYKCPECGAKPGEGCVYLPADKGGGEFRRAMDGKPTLQPHNGRVRLVPNPAPAVKYVAHSIDLSRCEVYELAGYAKRMPFSLTSLDVGLCRYCFPKGKEPMALDDVLVVSERR